MIDRKEFKKMAKKILKSDRGVQNPKLMHPAREWAVGILIGLIIIAASGAWSSNTYISYRTNSDINSNTSEKEIVVYRASQVEAALKTYADREAEFESLMNVNNLPTTGITTEPENEVVASTTLNGDGLDPGIEVSVESDDQETSEEDEGSDDKPETPPESTNDIIQVN